LYCLSLIGDIAQLPAIDNLAIQSGFCQCLVGLFPQGIVTVQAILAILDTSLRVALVATARFSMLEGRNRTIQGKKIGRFSVIVVKIRLYFAFPNACRAAHSL
jgi:hypothetical protein